VSGGWLSIKKSNCPEIIKPTKISAFKAMTPAMTSQITVTQNGIQIIVAQKKPRDLTAISFEIRLE
jgi:hypothetical protein